MIKIFTSASQQTGEQGEEAAARFLKKQGFAIVERNVANKFGEIDIVAKRKDVTHFFEVKTGKAGSAFRPADNLNRDKLRKFFRSVEYYCLAHRVKDYRVEGIIVLQNPDGTYTVETIELF